MLADRTEGTINGKPHSLAPSDDSRSLRWLWITGTSVQIRHRPIPKRSEKWVPLNFGLEGDPLLPG